MVTFVDDATSYLGHKDIDEVTGVTNKNFAAIEAYMHSNKLKKTQTRLTCLFSQSRVEARCAGGRRRNGVRPSPSLQAVQL